MDLNFPLLDNDAAIRLGASEVSILCTITVAIQCGFEVLGTISVPRARTVGVHSAF